MTKEEYIKYCNSLANQYEEDVNNNNIIVSEWIEKSVKREQALREDKRYYFNQEALDKFWGFCYYIGVVRRKRWKPLPFQSWIIMCLFSLYYQDKPAKRVRKYGVIWIARKNAKTFLGSLISLYVLLKEDVERNDVECYFLATSSDQAGQGLKELKKIIGCSPQVRKRVRNLSNIIKKKNSTGFIKALPNTPERLDSKNPNYATIDESHAHDSRDLFNIIDSGMKNRVNPLILEVSTAGYNKEYPFFNVLELGKKVLDGDDTQDNQFYAFFTLDSEDEIEQPEMWIKSNPFVFSEVGGYTVEELIEDYEKAKKISSDYDSFVIKNLNYYKDVSSTWIEDEAYKKCGWELPKGETLETFFEGCEAYGGIDLSATRDLSSLVWLIVKNDELYIIPDFYFPDNSKNKIRPNGIDLTPWIEDGHIIQHNRNTIDYKAIYKRVEYFQSFLEIQGIAYDKYLAGVLMPDIEKDLGIDIYTAPQTAMFFSTPLKQLERNIYDEEIHIMKNPCLRWNFSNVVLYFDGNDNIKIIKNKKKDSVDGAVSTGMAYGLMLRLKGEHTYYDEEDNN
ncbi:hypothetical protein E9993_01660 [Labilibacter sediminis]|nr:hypothetical protein E9993_01660 [Labilibacter sediminis]